MLIDCDRCGIRGDGCSGCLVTALFDADSATAGLGDAEARAIEVFARAGFDVEVLPAPRPPARRADRRRHRAA
ncbi:hypothetical protein [Micromonospora endolithica]|uniref:Uncharacterized protein n=1 Tax=Micromonospora endolithica TaxID=230091 RepID=A0A3A9ZRK2_9ACTN|nr:hypothetical protein [Micromonospora endolithica]RKN50849.1 hypothetical protein D7223_03630 [Micromonospora endolithica]TWJ20384.1 hypothetical protein JD76_00482 [Micromonospora endolithica]